MIRVESGWIAQSNAGNNDHRLHDYTSLPNSRFGRSNSGIPFCECCPASACQFDGWMLTIGRLYQCAAVPLRPAANWSLVINPRYRSSYPIWSKRVQLLTCINLKKKKVLCWGPTIIEQPRAAGRVGVELRSSWITVKLGLLNNRKNRNIHSKQKEFTLNAFNAFGGSSFEKLPTGHLTKAI